VSVIEKKPAEKNPVDKDAGAWRRRMIVFIPLIAFLALAAVFVLRLGAGDPSRIPSALIGHPAPHTDLPPLLSALGATVTSAVNVHGSPSAGGSS